MFTNLIESNSHTREFKRRGSFFLFTTATYALFFIAAGVMSIYAYDARLEDQNTEIITMLNPIELDVNKPPVPAVRNHAPAKDNNNGRSFAVRVDPMASVNRPDIAPANTSAKPNTNPPIPDGTRFVIGDHNSDSGIPRGSGIPGTGGFGDSSDARQPVVDVGAPPPTPVERRVPKIVSKGVITSQAIALPKPVYPPLARAGRIQGIVSVQVLIDESGKVISANAVSGNPALVHAAENAARSARFSPTTLSGVRVKVSGTITYNFTLQN